MEHTIGQREYVGSDGTRYRVRIVPDYDALSPRENDCNLATIETFDRDHHSPDKRNEFAIPPDYVSDWYRRVDMRRLRKWVALTSPGAVLVGLDRLHRGSAHPGRPGCAC